MITHQKKLCVASIEMSNFNFCLASKSKQLEKKKEFNCNIAARIV